MSTIRVGENETLDSALRRFKRKCARDCIISDIRRKEQYKKPSVKRKKKYEGARKRKSKILRKKNACPKVASNCSIRGFRQKFTEIEVTLCLQSKSTPKKRKLA